MAGLRSFKCPLSTIGLGLLLLSAAPVAAGEGGAEPLYLSGFDLPWLAVSTVSGSGSSSDPYLIRGVAIDARGGEYGIWIEDCDAFVVIEDCEISGCLSPSALGGIYLRNCTHVVIEDCVIHDNRVGIRADRSTGVTIRGNAIVGNYYGIDFGLFSTGNFVYANRFDNCENARAQAANQWSSLELGNCWSDATSGRPYMISPANVDSHAYRLEECPPPVDNAPPVIGAMPPLTFECCTNALPEIPDVFAMDDVDGRIRADVDTRQVNFRQPGVYPVTVTACDAAGNCAEAKLTASVLDTLSPRIVLTGAEDVCVECGEDLGGILPGASAIDECDRAPRLTVDSRQLDATRPGTYRVLYRAEDVAGNSGEAVRTVRVADTTAPILVVEGDDPLYLGSDFSVSDLTCGVRAVDVCEGELAPEWIEVEYSAEELQAQGSTVARYGVRDSWGNVSDPVTRVLVTGPLCPEQVSDPVLGEVSITCEVAGDELTISASLPPSVEADALRFLRAAELIQRLLAEVEAVPVLALRIAVDIDGLRFVEFFLPPSARSFASRKPDLFEFLKTTLYGEIGVWEGCDACRPPQDVDQARQRALAAVSFVVPQAESAIARVYARDFSFPTEFSVDILYYLAIEAKPSDYPDIASGAERLAQLVDVLLGGSQSMTVTVFGNLHGVIYRGSLRGDAGDEMVWTVEYVNPILETEWP